MANEIYKSLFNVVKLILILSHGQATVEESFGVNKEVEVENLKELTLVAQNKYHVLYKPGLVMFFVVEPLLKRYWNPASISSTVVYSAPYCH